MCIRDSTHTHTLTHTLHAHTHVFQRKRRKLTLLLRLHFGCWLTLSCQRKSPLQDKLLVCLKQIKRHTIRGKKFCDWTCSWFCVDLIGWLFLDATTNSCFTSWLPRCEMFSYASFWRHQCVFDVTHRKLSVLCTGHGWNACGLQSVLSPIVLVSVEWTSDDILYRSRQQEEQLIDDRLYSVILRSLEQTHCARTWFYMSD